MNNAFAYVVGESATRLWGLSSRQRLTRQLREVGGITVVDDLDQLPPDSKILLLRADHLFETRTLVALSQQSNTLLVPSGERQAAAAIVDQAYLRQAMEMLGGADAECSGSSCHRGSSDAGCL